MSAEQLDIFKDRDEILSKMETEFRNVVLNMRLREIESTQDALELVTDSFLFVASYGGMIRQLIDEEIARRKQSEA